MEVSVLLSPKPKRDLRALIIEDDALIGALLAELLEGMSYECEVEATEAGAVASARRHRPDLMIVDVRLRAGCGIDAVERIFRAGPLPHIFITGDPAQVRRRRSGAIVVQKPFRTEVLTSAIEQLLGAPRPN